MAHSNSPDLYNLPLASRRSAVFHGEVFTSDPFWRDAFTALGISARSRWTISGDAEVVTTSATATVYRISLVDGQAAYIKHERYPLSKSIKRWMRPAKTTVEVFSYQQLKQAGVPTPQVLAWGERRCCGCITESFIATLAVPDTLDLRRFVSGPWAAMSGVERREVFWQIANRLAAQLRAAHAAGFVHHDLKWRNVLVRRGEEGFIPVWIDAPRGAVWHWRRRRQAIVDIGDLARSAIPVTSVFDRMRFICRYLGRDRRPREAIKLYRSIAARVSRRDR